MAFEPTKLLEGLTKGLIDATYDFVRLTFSAFAIPFFAIPFLRPRRFWFETIAIQRRLSPLAYLFLWAVVAISMALDSGSKVLSSIVGLDKATDLTIVGVITNALLIVVLVDLTVRITLYLVPNRARRKLYGSLARIATGNIFFGALLVILSTTPSWILPPAFDLAGISLIKTPWGEIPFIWPAPILMLFGLSLSAVILKALKIVGWTRKFVIGAVIAAVGTWLVLNISVLSLYLTEKTKNWMSPATRLAINQHSIRCSFGPNAIRVTGFLSLQGKSRLPLRPEDFVVYYDDYSGNIQEGQRGVVLSNEMHTWIDFVAQYDSKDPSSKATAREAECQLVLLTEIYNLSGGQEVEVKSPEEKQ